jgi:lysyl-tRNA synthetase class 2
MVTDVETLARFPQLELDLSATKRRVLHIRAAINRSLRHTLDASDFTEVNTPILGADAGGAVATPFETHSQRLGSSRPLFLRIAPELELKKMVAAGFDRVYELGPCFRNEGLDATHNPEFTTLELYRAYATIDDLTALLARLLTAIQTSLLERDMLDARLPTLPNGQVVLHRLPFLPTLTQQIKLKIPSFTSLPPLTHAAAPSLLALLSPLGIDPSSAGPSPSTPQLLDLLATHLLEPLCIAPTLITDYPAITSPLAKSYLPAPSSSSSSSSSSPSSSQFLAARAELFVNGIEYANLYEEENSPFAQARKFLAQKGWSGDCDDGDGGGGDGGGGGGGGRGGAATSNMSYRDVLRLLTKGQRYYVRCLEMGLPPTGGMGIGIDRLAMLFGNAKRIGDVLPFGGLKSVVAMGS